MRDEDAPPGVLNVDPRAFAAFAAARRQAVVLVGAGGAATFLRAVAERFADGALGYVHRPAVVDFARWAASHLGAALDGYWLLAGGRVVAHHHGAAPGAVDALLDLVVAAAGARAAPVADETRRRAEAIRADAVIAAFEHALARARPDTPTPAPQLDEDDPFVVLGVDDGAPLDDVRAAYHRHLALNHPDKVAHLSVEIQRFATERTRRLTDAYERIVRRRR